MLTPTGTELRIAFHISIDHAELQATMDSPDQCVSDIPLTEIRFDGQKLMMVHEGFGLTYIGRLLPSGEIEGTFHQDIASFGLVLNRVETPKPALET